MVSYDTLNFLVSRPSHKELDGKLRVARELIVADQFRILKPTITAQDLIELDCSADRETLPDLLDEISPENYAGQRPPMRAYEEEIRDCELFAFAWNSTKLEKNTYMKFAVKNNVFWLVSLHIDR